MVPCIYSQFPKSSANYSPVLNFFATEKEYLKMGEYSEVESSLFFYSKQ